MAEGKSVELTDVNAGNVSETGFFCFMSRRKSEGYRRKLEWLQARFAEGMKIKMLKLPERGFIEYIPGEYAWRAVDAKGYMFIHCFWIVGKSKGKGLGKLLLGECIRDARNAGMPGVAMVTSEGNWLMGKKFLEKHGFVSVDQALPSFNLMVKKFKDAPSPSFVGAWDTKLIPDFEGVTIFRSDQCPYIEDAANIILGAAKESGIKSQVLEIDNCQAVREIMPSPFGNFSIVYNGTLLSYHYLTHKDFLNKVQSKRREL